MGNYQIESQDALVQNRLVQVTDWVQIDYLDTTAKLVCWLPVGAVVLDVLVNVTTLFNDSGTDYMQVGTATDPDAYGDDMTLAAATMVAESQNTTPVIPGIRLTADTAVYAVYEGQNSNATAGVAQVSIVWAPSHQKELDT